MSDVELPKGANAPSDLTVEERVDCLLKTTQSMLENYGFSTGDDLDKTPQSCNKVVRIKDKLDEVNQRLTVIFSNLNKL